MKSVGGNTTATVMRSSGETFNEVGERIKAWVATETLTGWLDFVSGEATSAAYKARLEDVSHVFIAEHAPLSVDTAEQARLVVNGQDYEIRYVDNPMGMGYHLEIFLRRLGS